MWRFKQLLFFFLLPAAVLSAQEPGDSAYFVKYATPLFELQIGNFTGPFLGMSDSTFQFMLSPYKMYNHCVITDRTIYKVKNTYDTSGYKVVLNWDKQLRLESMQQYPFDSSSTVLFTEEYLTGMKPKVMVLQQSGKNASLDSSHFSYGNNGLVSGIAIHHIADKTDTIFRENRLYDANNKLIVAENALYGTIRGTFTYEYDGKGNLARRVFLTRAGGAVLCTDTLEYSFTDSLHRIMSCVHLLSVGNRDWMRLEEVQSRVSDGKPVMYALYYAGERKSRLHLAPGSELRISYDSITGKKTMEERINADHSRIETATFYYSKEKDSVLYYSRNGFCNSCVATLDKKEVRIYSPVNGRLIMKQITHYDYYYRRKKTQVITTSAESVVYEWSKY